ncbi:MAG TPA: DUF5677 domain-containing protein [Bacilli bacterium]|nr:DUF5677 domain-containing protein [Bacilli bacterium]HPS18645.1 DUF5677 domain-containing protein [Bacilli bacterium]
MNKITALSKEQIFKIVDYLKVPAIVEKGFIYETYELAVEAISQLSELAPFEQIANINSFEIVEYCVGEFLYSVAVRSPEQIKEFIANENIKTSMASIVADKYISISKLQHRERRIANSYFPPISSLSVYLNFTLNILQKYDKNDPVSTLLTDLLMKSLSIAKCSLSLLVDGFETEAFSSWRTLHECECTLILLEHYGDPLINLYLKHMKYGIAFKDVMDDKDKQTDIFNNMKEEMKQYDLKSKDIKKYIEYGWLYGIPEVKKDEAFKLNFRDGLEKVAGLSMYNSRYEMSSEIIHSTPMLIYSNKDYFYYITLLSLYESFFRLEKVFVSLFSKCVSPEQMKRYEAMRNVYYTQLVNIHKRESANFKILQQKDKKKGN